MRASSAAFDAAIAASENSPVTAVSFAWPARVTGVPAIPLTAVESFTGQGSYTTDMPEGTKLITGYPARMATLVLSGYVGADETQSAQWLFDDWSVSSPLYGADWTGADGVLIEVSQGLQLPGAAAPELFEQFTGYVDKASTDRATGQVTLSLIDPRLKVSKVPSLPMAIAANPANGYQNPGLTALWPLDFLLRDNGVYSGPPPRPGCLWYMSGHGSLWPEIGQVTSSSQMYGASAVSGTTPPAWVPGMFAGQAPATFTEIANLLPAGQRLIAQTITGAGAVVTFEGWVKSAAGAAGPIGSCQLANPANGDGLQFGFYQDAAGFIWAEMLVMRAGAGTAPATGASATGAGWHQVTAYLRFNSGGTATYQVWLDRVAQPTATITGLSAQVNDPTVVTAQATVPVDTWQVASSSTTSPLPTPSVFTSMTSLDASLNNLTAIPAYTAADAWGLIQQIAEAEFAVAGLDEAWLFIFRNRANRQTGPVTTVTSLTRVKDLQVSKSESTRALTVTAVAHPLTVLPAAPIWQASANIYIDARASATVLASLSSPAVFIPTGAFNYGPPGAPVAPFTANSYRAARRLDYGNPVSNLTITAAQISSQTVAITISNPNAFAVALIDTTTGSPSMTLVGQAAAAGGAAAAGSLNADGSVTISSVYGNGYPALALTDTVWRQDPATVQQLTDDQLSDLIRPRPIIENLVIIGDPRLQLGDRIRVQDTGGLATNGGYRPPASIADDVIIISVSPSASPTEGFTQTLTARTVAAPRQWVLGQAGKSELGSTTWI